MTGPTSRPYNPLDHPLSLAVPSRLSSRNDWHGHIPFAFMLVGALKPDTIVELGVHWGDSYLAFCQAVELTGRHTRCIGVDTFCGDAEMGEYGPEVLEAVKRDHDTRYSGFSDLWKMTFREASEKFTGKVDILHIDGMHSYEPVKQDFEDWERHLSDRSVVLFHDTINTYPHFGVEKFFQEVAPGKPRFRFFHSFGLGVLLYGKDQPEWLVRIAGGEDQVLFLKHFEVLGARIGLMEALRHGR